MYSENTLPIIEIVCVAYKTFGLMRVLVQSIINQTASNWRLTVIHDGPDETFVQIMKEYANIDSRIKYDHTDHRYNDYGHSLREIALVKTTGDYILITNHDNYYVPKFIEFMNTIINNRIPDVVIFNMIHSHNRPGNRPQASYCLFETIYSRRNIDMGAAIVRGSIARQAGFRDHSYNGDATYFEDVKKILGDKIKVSKVPKVLLVHN